MRYLWRAKQKVVTKTEKIEMMIQIKVSRFQQEKRKMNQIQTKMSNTISKNKKKNKYYQR